MRHHRRVTNELRRERYGCPDWCHADHESFDRADDGALAPLERIGHAGPEFGPGMNGWAVEVTQLGSETPRVYIAPGDEFLDLEVASELSGSLARCVDWLREQATAAPAGRSSAG